jgi:hypothetical protein
MAYHLKLGIRDNRGHALTSCTRDAVKPKGFSAHISLIYVADMHAAESAQVSTV